MPTGRICPSQPPRLCAAWRHHAGAQRRGSEPALPYAGDLAVSTRPQGLRMLSQYAARFYGRIGYHDYEGITDGRGAAPDLGEPRQRDCPGVAPHGALTVGRTVSQAFVAASTCPRRAGSGCSRNRVETSRWKLRQRFASAPLNSSSTTTRAVAAPNGRRTCASPSRPEPGNRPLPLRLSWLCSPDCFPPFYWMSMDEAGRNQTASH